MGTLAKDLAGRGQAHELVGADDQLGAQFAFQDPDLLAYGRLREPQQLARSRKAPFVGEREERFQQFDIQIASPP